MPHFWLPMAPGQIGVQGKGLREGGPILWARNRMLRGQSCRAAGARKILQRRSFHYTIPAVQCTMWPSFLSSEKFFVKLVDREGDLLAKKIRPDANISYLK